MILDFQFKDHYDMNDLIHIMQILRAPGGCPWDREQTHVSVRKNFIEETYEAVEAIDTNDPVLLCEELGDVLEQVAFHSVMEQEKGTFSFGDVTDGICKKMIYRHPHVFSDVQADTSAQVLDNWDKLKKKEKGHNTKSDVLHSVSSALPALMRGQKVLQKAYKGVEGQDDPRIAFKGLQQAAEALLRPSDDEKHREEQMGEALLALVNIGRLQGVDCEQALFFATERFISRFDGE